MAQFVTTDVMRDMRIESTEQDRQKGALWCVVLAATALVHTAVGPALAQRQVPRTKAEITNPEAGHVVRRALQALDAIPARFDRLLDGQPEHTAVLLDWAREADKAAVLAFLDTPHPLTRTVREAHRQVVLPDRF